MIQPRERLVTLCCVLMQRRTDDVPCTHNLLARLRDDARDGQIGDDEAQAFIDLLNMKIANAMTGPTAEGDVK